MVIWWIPREEPLRKECRHCRNPQAKYLSLWNVLLERYCLEYNREEGFDHVTCDRYWLISQPYTSKDELTMKVLAFDRCSLMWRATTRGCEVYGISPGYHHPATTTLIVVPKDKDGVIKAIHETLETYTATGIWRRFQTTKAAVKRLLKDYDPPDAKTCLRMALDYLTWKDKQS
jgi:hypothetical protein